jgi:hypothetical protein
MWCVSGIDVRNSYLKEFVFIVLLTLGRITNVAPIREMFLGVCLRVDSFCAG